MDPAARKKRINMLFCNLLKMVDDINATLDGINASLSKIQDSALSGNQHSATVLHKDPYRSTGGFMRRVGADHLVISREEQVVEYKDVTIPGNFLPAPLAQLSRTVRMPTGQTYRQRVVEHYDRRGIKTGVSIYDRDTFGKKYYQK